MSEIKIAKIKIRRGTDAQRTTVVFDQGEIVYSTNGQRLYVGDGVELGGKSVSSKTHAPVASVNSLTAVNAEKNDTCYANDTLYQLTGTDASDMAQWKDIGGLVLDDVTLEKDSVIQIKDGGVGINQLDTNAFYRGVQHDGTAVRINHSAEFDTTGDVLSLATNSVTESNITSSTFTGVLSGGSGVPVELNYDTTWFEQNSAGELTLTDAPSFGYPDIDQDMFDIGFNFDNINETINCNVAGADDTRGLNIDGSFLVGLEGLYGSSFSSAEFSSFNIDVHGRITNMNTSLFDTVSSLSAAAGSTTEHIGTPNQAAEGYPITNLTEIIGLSSNGLTSEQITLSSAGFITFSGGLTAQTGKEVPRFAIPVYIF